jgi:hypothetical protein
MIAELLPSVEELGRELKGLRNDKQEEFASQQGLVDERCILLWH